MAPFCFYRVPWGIYNLFHLYQGDIPAVQGGRLEICPVLYNTQQYFWHPACFLRYSALQTHDTHDALKTLFNGFFLLYFKKLTLPPSILSKRRKPDIPSLQHTITLGQANYTCYNASINILSTASESHYACAGRIALLHYLS